MGQRNTTEASSYSTSEIGDAFPAALGLDLKKKEVIPSIWASAKDLEANG
jgi:hypothetical protein